MLFRPKQPPLRFAHPSGALGLDQASRDAMRSVFDGMGKRLTVLQLMPRIEAVSYTHLTLPTNREV